MYTNKRRVQDGAEKSQRSRIGNKKQTGKRGRANETYPDGNKKIAAGRLTMPLQFFSEGIKSEIVRKNDEDCILNKQSRQFLNEDLHALLQNVPNAQGLRLSQSISAKHSGTAPISYKSAADYYLHCESKQQASTRQTVTRNEQSLFKEIDRCYRRQQIVSNSSITSVNLSEEEPFCRRLLDQLALISIPNRKRKISEKIKSVVTEINASLDGKETVSPSQMESKNATKSVAEETVLPLVSKSSWQYRTPSRQGIKRRSTGCSYSTELKPCILQTNSQSTALFELDVDNTNFTENVVFYKRDKCNRRNNSNMKSIFCNNTFSLFENVVDDTTQDVPRSHFFKFMQSPEPLRLSIFSDNDKQQQQMFSFNKKHKTRIEILEPIADRNVHHFKKRSLFQFENNFDRKHFELKEPSVLKRCTRETFDDLLPWCSRRFEESKENFCNGPAKSEFGYEQKFQVDDGQLFPMFLDLTESSPIKFFSRKL